MFRTDAQNRASRENGAKSHGPVTPEGKQTASRNATKHGLFSDSILLRPENRDAWHRLSQDLVDRFCPADNVELSVIYDMAATQWRKDRALHIEAALLDMEYQAIDDTENQASVPGDEIRRIAVAWANAAGRTAALADLSRQILRLGNYWMRLHRKLKELQADRKAAEAEDFARAEAEAAAEAKAAADLARQTPAEPRPAEPKFEPGIPESPSFQRHEGAPHQGAHRPVWDGPRNEPPSLSR